MFTDILLAAEGFLQTLESVDKQLLLSVNGSDSLFLDRVVRTLTHGATWIPLYLSLFYVVLNNNNTVRKVLLVVGAAALCYLLAGAVDDGIVKPLVARWRPTHDPEIGLLVDVVDGYRGGRYGFFSAHAANTFSIAVLFCWLVRSRLLSVTMIIWSFVNCWTRLYLGDHFPGDILVGLCWGGLVGTGVYFLFRYCVTKWVWTPTYTSQAYTKTGFIRDDADMPVCVLVFTLIYAVLRACLA